MKTNNDVIPVEVFCGTIWEAEMVKSLLENAEIEVFLKDEINGTMVPWVTSAGGVGSVKVVVSSLDYEKSRMIVEQYENNKQ
jgi:predicted transcriptional regulator